MNNQRKAIFFDRDGVINRDRSDYVKTVEELEIFSNIVEPIKRLKNTGFLIIILTNQSAINRGLTTHENVNEIHMAIQNFFTKNGTSIDRFYYCHHRPDENCSCRKPKAGLLYQAIKELNIDIKSSWLIGDKDSDIQAAITAGCKAIKIDTNLTFNKAIKIILNSNECIM